MTSKRFNFKRFHTSHYLSMIIGIGGATANGYVLAQDLDEPISVPSTAKTSPSPARRKLTAAEIDWVEYVNLTPAQQATISGSCKGKYIDPHADASVDSKQDMDSLPLIVEANSSIIDGGNKAILEGDVVVTQGQQSIKAHRMTYDRTIDEALLETNVTIRQPGMLVVGQVATASTVKNHAEFKESSFLLHETHMRGSAESVSQTNGGSVLLINGNITSCEPESNAWSLQGAELFLDQTKGQGYGKHVRIEVADVPIFYLPYISFPLGEQRQSGFLYPSIGSDDGGLDIAVPYYWNIAPNYDATITPRLVSGRGAMLETEFRHLSRTFSHDVNLGFLPDDDGGVDEEAEDLVAAGELDQEESTPHKGQDRWIVQFEQNTVANKPWNLYTSYSKVSDIDYLRDLSTSSFNVGDSTYLNQQIQIGYELNEWTFDAQLQNYQVLLSDVDSPYQKLPEINVNGDYYLGKYKHIGHVNAELKHQYTYFDHSETFQLDDSPFITGQRLVTHYDVNNTLENEWGYFKAGTGYKTLSYLLNDLDDTDSELKENLLTYGAAQVTIDMGVALENTSGTFRQTIEPRIFYVYRRFTDQSDLYDIDNNNQSLNFDTSVRTFSYDQLYRDSRFSGYDRLDDANRITLGLTSRWFSKTSGNELLSGSVGQILHFTNRRIGLNETLTREDDTSELAANISFPVGGLADAYMSAIYNQSSQKVDRLSTGINFATNENQTLINVLYSYIALNPEVDESERIEQIDTNFFTPINDQWAVFGRANFDFENDQELESFIGLEYDSCCYRFSILARRWLDSNIANLSDNNSVTFDNGIFFEIQLKGLGGSGAKVKSILEDSIPGYRDR